MRYLVVVLVQSTSTVKCTKRRVVVGHNLTRMEATTNLLTTSFFLVGQAVAAVVTIIVKSEETEMLEVGFGQGVPGGRQTQIGGRSKGKQVRPQIRRLIAKIHKSLGPHYFRWAYRMTYASFCNLHELLRAGIQATII
jgi:hypothetical protein